MNEESLVESSKGWYSRGYLPHCDYSQIQFVTFRLADSLPKGVIERICVESEALPESKSKSSRYSSIEKFVDCGYGRCLLRDPSMASIVVDQLQFRDGINYDLHAWVIMPNHVHVLTEVKQGFSLPRIVQSWKARTARKINLRLGETGAVWYRDYYDRFIRNEDHYINTTSYILNNPVKAGLCQATTDWQFSWSRNLVQA